MLRFIVSRGFPPFAAGDEIIVTATEAQWLWDITVAPVGVHPLRVRDDVWVEWGHVEETNHYLDTSD